MHPIEFSVIQLIPLVSSGIQIAFELAADMPTEDQVLPRSIMFDPNG